MLFFNGHVLDIRPVASEGVEGLERDVDGPVMRGAGGSHDSDEPDVVVDVNGIARIYAAGGIERCPDPDVKRPCDVGARHRLVRF